MITPASVHDEVEILYQTIDIRRDLDTIDAGSSRAVVTQLSTVAPKAIEWIWKGWLAQRKLHIFGGHPGDGKSTITIDLIARLSRGDNAPDGSPLPVGNSLIIAAEDGIADTIRPRLDLHGADPFRVFALEHIVDDKGNDRSLNLGSHVEELREAIRKYDIRLVVIDPITSYLSKTDRNSEGDVRDSLMPLLSMIEETGIACIGIMHVGKGGSQGRKPLQQLLGSTAFGAIARVVWMTAELSEEDQPLANDDDPDEVRKVLGVVKSNIGPIPPGIDWSRPLDSAIKWHGPSAQGIGDVMNGSTASKLDEAIENITNQLRNGPKSQKLIQEEAVDAGISRGTFNRAYKHLRGKGAVRSSKANYSPYPWLWEWVAGDAHTRAGTSSGGRA